MLMIPALSGSCLQDNMVLPLDGLLAGDLGQMMLMMLPLLGCLWERPGK